MTEIVILNQRIKLIKIQNLLEKPGLPFFLACLAVLLTLPALWAGWQVDDWIHRMLLLGRSPFPPANDGSLFGLFSFLDGEPQHTRQLMDSGLVPWWTFEGLRIQFWRPLSELTHYLDYMLWPESAFLMHLQSLVWFGCLVWVVARLYSNTMPKLWVAGLAALLFAMDDAHGGAVSWLANRNVLIAMLFGVLTLLCHDKWRRQIWKPGILLAPFCLALGLLGGESALSAGAYLVSYAVFIDKATLRQRIMSLLPYAAVCGIWFAWYHHFGFGSRGSGMYIDPIQDPLPYASAFIMRAPVFLLGQLAMPPANLFTMLSETGRPLMWVSAVVFCFAFIVVVFPLLRQSPEARFWMLGMILALFPICMTAPDNRLLFFVGLGGMGLVAQFLGGCFEKAGWMPEAKSWHRLAVVYVNIFLVFHLFITPVLLPISTRFDKFFDPVVNKPAKSDILNPDFPGQQVVLVNPPGALFVYYMNMIRIARNVSFTSLRTLATGDTSLQIARSSDRTLTIIPEHGFITGYCDDVFRKKPSMQVSQKVELNGMTVEVLSLTRDQRPEKARFVFTVPLEDYSLKFLQWDGETYIRFRLPEIGETIKLPATGHL